MWVDNITGNEVNLGDYVLLESGLQVIEAGKRLGMDPIWKPPTLDGHRSIDASFDHITQRYRDALGNELEDGCGWSHSCILCRGPASYIDCDAYREEYRCLECSNTFYIK